MSRAEQSSSRQRAGRTVEGSCGEAELWSESWWMGWRSRWAVVGLRFECSPEAARLSVCPSVRLVLSAVC